VKLYLNPAMGMVVMSLGLLQTHLSAAVEPGHPVDIARSAADAALHFWPEKSHVHEFHLAHSWRVFPLSLHLFSTKPEALPFCAQLPVAVLHEHCEPLAVHDELVVSMLQQRS